MTQPSRTIVQLPSGQAGSHRTRTGLIISGAALLIAVGVGVTVAGRTDAYGSVTTAVVPGVTEIVVDIAAGSVDLTGGPGDVVEIRTIVHTAWGSTPRAEHRVVDGVLTVSASCPGFSIDCEVDEQLTVPAGVPIRVGTDGGSVSARDLDTPGLVVNTGAGAVDATFISPPQRVDIRTGAGSVDLRLPDVGYQVAADAGLGNRRIGISVDSAAERSITLETGVGAVTVLPR